MRFLHTSDWHLGKTLKGRSRAEEHEAALIEILDIIRNEKVDCALITGDVFDSQAPSPEAEHLAFNFFSELRGLKVPAVVIGGNHDHPKRLLAIRDVLKVLDIHVRPEPIRPADGGLVEIEKNGELARIAVLPFVTAGKIEDASKLMGPEIQRYQEYAERISAMADLLSSSFSKTSINLLLAHLYVDGAETSKSEREIHVAKPYAVSAQRFPSTAHYIALGHLHRPQEIHAPSRTLYAGSVLQLDFGERDQQKRVVIIDAHPGKPATIEDCPLSAGKNLRDVSGTLSELTAQAHTFGEDFLRVTIKVDKPVPGIADTVHEILPNALEIRLDYPRLESEAIEIAGSDPYELFSQFYLHQRASSPPDALTELFRSLYEEALNASD
ncbi:MAG TPA: exonuclease SbcCD subunit D [Pyrinomonadaceae bacterium]|nr:exonuclease SbcCD subunit D [Pyrinomonadaceae bacterium]